MLADKGTSKERMHILHIEHNLSWLPLPNEVALILSDQLPSQTAVTSALALAFDGDRMLFTNLRQRRWDIPGGHVEPNERIEQTMHREVLEETGAILGNVHVFAYQRFRLLGAVPPKYRYPYPDSYQVFFLATIATLGEYVSTIEASERALFGPQDARALCWVQQNRPLYEAALASCEDDL